MVKVILTRIDSLEENKVNLSGGEVSIGRGSILGCDDKRISRKHGILQVSDDGSITLVSMHSNPCFYKVQNLDSYTVLVKGQSKVLGPGDEFALLPDSFRYRVDLPNAGPDLIPPAKVENANGVGKNLTASKRKRMLPGWLTDLSAGGSETVSSVAASSRKRKAPSGGGMERDRGLLQTPTNPERPAPSSDTSSRMRIASLGGGIEEDEEIESRIKQEPSTVSASPSPTASVEENGEFRVKQEPSVAISPSPSSSLEQDEEVETPKKQGGVNGKKDGYEAEYGGAASTSLRRDLCPYGAGCYRKNPGHRTEMSHPGDADYPVLPECPYGASCYRRNPQHRRDYGHAGPPATPPPPATATAAASPTSNVNYYSCNVSYNVCPKCQNTTCIDLTKDDQP